MAQTSKRPIIIIPGTTGSQLFNSEPHESLLNNKEIEDNFLVTLVKEILN